jgi:predicted methyltransferase
MGERGVLRLVRHGLSALGLLAAVTVSAGPSAAQAPGSVNAALRTLVDGKQRSPANSVRDRFRRPFEVIQFLDIRPGSTVIEISPGAAGYWTEILAPYLRDHGLYIAANPAPSSPAAKAGVEKFNALFRAKLASDPASFARVRVIDFAPELPDFAPPGSADYVLTFRNLHNWMDRGVVDKAIASFHRVLRKGGILGIKDHRGKTDQPQDPRAKSGYVRQDYAIALIEKAGFKLMGAITPSPMRATPRTTRSASGHCRPLFA